MTQAVEPKAWVDPAPGRPVPIWDGLRQDVLAHISPEHRNRSRWSWTWVALKVAVRSSSFHVTALYRMAHLLHHRAGLVGRVLAGFLFWCSRHGYSCAIAPSARLHGGLILPHPQGIVVGASVAMGPRGWIFQNATLGGAPGKEGMPRVGSDARIFAGAVLSGPIALGDNVVVGANAVVSQDVPARTIVRCPPAECSPLPERFQVDNDSDIMSS